MAITVGTNSYVTIAEADEYFQDKLYSTDWNEASESTKEKALKTAAKKIDSQRLRGRKVETSQILEFPRSIYSQFEKYLVSQTEVPQAVKDAQCEEAFALISMGENANKRAQLQALGVKSFSIGKLSETFVSNSSKGNKLLSMEAIQFLSPYLAGRVPIC